MLEIAPGLWRWTAPHPAWRPGAERDSPADWDKYVGSVLYVGTDAAVFIDPVLLREEKQFWSWADERVAGRSVVVLTALLPHRRNREQVAHRYGASTSRVKRDLPDGVESIVLRGARQTMFWLPEHRALIPGDRILGARDGGLMLCPESWLYWVRVNRDQLRRLLHPLLDQPIKRVLVSQGQALPPARWNPPQHRTAPLPPSAPDAERPGPVAVTSPHLPLARDASRAGRRRRS